MAPRRQRHVRRTRLERLPSYPNPCRLNFHRRGWDNYVNKHQFLSGRNHYRPRQGVPLSIDRVQISALH